MMMNNYPNMCVDGVIFTYIDDVLKVLLIKRTYEPFKDKYALPGGFIRPYEDGYEGIRRVLVEETGLKVDYVEQLYTFTDPYRDERGRIVSISHYALLNSTKQNLTINKHASEVKWVNVEEASKYNLAFDHNEIFQYAIERLKNKLRYEPIGFDLLDKYFTLSELHKLYSTILGKDIDRRNFNKKILKSNLLNNTTLVTSGSVGRSAKLYKFNVDKYYELKNNGLNFEL